MRKLYLENLDFERFLPDEDWKCCHYVYSHGKIEEEAGGYDIVGYSKKDGFDFKTDRIEDVIVITPSGKEVPARLFFWHSAPYDEMSAKHMQTDYVYNCHGLVVDLCDNEAIEDAMRKYNSKTGIV